MGIVDNTAVIVPGAGSNADKLGSAGTGGRDPYRTRTGNRAVVVWLDGPEPQSVLPDAGFNRYANEGTVERAKNLINNGWTLLRRSRAPPAARG